MTDPKHTDATILKGVGKIDGDGWKDTTRVGEVVFVWNTPLPPPYSPGQYPRVGNETWTASIRQYDFIPASVEEVRRLLSTTPDADKLKLAVEALERIVEYSERGTEEIANEALASLKAEG